MAIDERERHHLHQRLDEVLGSAEAAILMAHLRPVGWTDVTTNRELGAFREEFHARFGQVDARFGQMEARFGQMEARFEQLEAKFDRIDSRFEVVDARFDGLRHEIGEHMSGLRVELHESLREQLQVTIFAFVACLATFSSVMVAAVKL